MSSIYKRIKARLREMSTSEIQDALSRVDSDMKDAHERGTGVVHVVGGATDLLPSVVANARGMSLSGVAAYFGQATGKYLDSRVEDSFFERKSDSYSVKQQTDDQQQLRHVEEENYLALAA